MTGSDRERWIGAGGKGWGVVFQRKVGEVLGLKQ
jgi:hypothetical protein